MKRFQRRRACVTATPTGKMFRKLLPLISVAILLAVLCAGGAYYYICSKAPAPQGRIEIFRGIHYRCVPIGDPARGSGNVMVVEIDLDADGVELLLRPYDLDALESGKHYTLQYPDFAIRRHDLGILLNGVMYDNPEPYSSLPGMKKRVNETVVVNGVPSHVHAHSYLLWWDAAGRGSVARRKPPRSHILEQAVLGVGLQAVSVRNGRPASYLINGSNGDVEPRTFIGISERGRKVWMMAFEAATEHGMADFCAETGVHVGGALDSGDSTTLLIGDGADGVSAYTGIRGQRPLASWIGVRAQPLAGSE